MALECWVRLEPEEHLRMAKAEGYRISFSKPFVDGPLEWDPYDWVEPTNGLPGSGWHRQEISALQPTYGGVIAVADTVAFVFTGVSETSAGSMFNYTICPRDHRRRRRLARSLRSLADRLES